MAYIGEAWKCRGEAETTPSLPRGCVAASKRDSCLETYITLFNVHSAENLFINIIECPLSGVRMNRYSIDSVVRIDFPLNCQCKFENTCDFSAKGGGVVELTKIDSVYYVPSVCVYGQISNISTDKSYSTVLDKLMRASGQITWPWPRSVAHCLPDKLSTQWWFTVCF